MATLGQVVAVEGVMVTRLAGEGTVLMQAL